MISPVKRGLSNVTPWNYHFYALTAGVIFSIFSGFILKDSGLSIMGLCGIAQGSITE
jgi:hypothetical protein